MSVKLASSIGSVVGDNGRVLNMNLVLHWLRHRLSDAPGSQYVPRILEGLLLDEKEPPSPLNQGNPVIASDVVVGMVRIP